MSIKRYMCTMFNKTGQFGECMEPSDSGPWVRVSDVDKLIDQDVPKRQNAGFWGRTAARLAEKIKNKNTQIIALQSENEALRSLLSEVKGCFEAAKAEDIQGGDDGDLRYSSQRHRTQKAVPGI